MSLESYLVELRNPSRPIINAKLINLSRLSPEELRLFAREWPTIEVERRRQVLGRLVELAEDNVELDFEALFRSCLNDLDEEVRAEAVKGLWECEDCSLIEPLAGLLRNDQAPAVRAAAALGLGQFALLAELMKLHPRHAAKVEHSLLTTIEDEAEVIEVRRRAIEAIAPLSLPQVSEVIDEAYASSNPDLQVSAIRAMGRNCDARWLPTLIKELDNPDPWVRFEAAGACGELVEEGAVPHLIPLIHDADVEVRSAAIWALGQIGGGQAKQALRACRDDPNELVRQAAEEALRVLRLEENPFSIGY